MRLIDADALLKEDFTERFIDDYDNTVFEVIIEDAPTVDIKTEVAREIFAEIEKAIGRKLHIDDHIRTYGRDSSVSCNLLAELKNKYTKEGVE